MSHIEKDYDDLPVEELERELREAFLCTDRIDGPLNDELEKLREALNRKRPVEYLYTPEESWSHFLEDNAEELEPFLFPKAGTEERTKGIRTAKRRLTGKGLRWSLIAAVVVVLLAGAALAADSLGLWAWTPRWNAAAGRYEPAAMEVSGDSPIPAALAEMGITEPVYPEKLPEGFVITESHISEDPLLLTERYARGDRVLSITVTPIKGVKTALYQQGGEVPRTLDSGRGIHYAFANKEVITVVRYGKDYATTLSGNLPLGELEAVIYSLGDKTEGGPQP